ncbi:hypothetical protein MRB53_030418 [Persea americana]|uniref:Uncharacterized protein n=1 Tax=Persea americana TaxID=3435 RepID=A0ACC2KL21_PERAE|nr:hypothetical protein MRB53_030418 [Persea americana]
MGHHCCSKQKVKRGLWSPEEDEKLIRYITTHGHGCWSSVPKHAGLQRCGKSCRLRWINYLRPDLKRGSFSAQEERVIIDVHRILGNRWAQIAKHLPGRTDNEVKNFWNSCIKKKLIAQGLDPKTHNLLPSHNKNHACNVSQLHHQSSTPFTINSHMKMGESHSSVDMNTPFITLPTPQPPPPQPPLHPPLQEAIQIPTNFPYEDLNTSSTNTTLLWNIKDQSSNHPMDFTCTSLENTPISSSFNPLEYGYTDENCLWGSNVQPLEAQAMNHHQQQLQHQEQQQQPKLREMDFDESNEEKGQDMETSYNKSHFDLEFMESTLMPCSIYGNTGSMEPLAWDDC